MAQELERDEAWLWEKFGGFIVPGSIDFSNPYHDAKGRFTSRAHASRLGVEEESLSHGGKKYKTHVLRGESAWHIARETFRSLRERWGHTDIGEKAEAAFDHYIITGYEGINATLRGNEKKVEYILDTFYKHRMISRDAMKRKFARHGQELIDAINKHKIKEDIVFFRNISGQAAGDIHKAVSYGAHVLLDKGILSCALFQDVEQAKHPDNLPVAILVKKGSPGLVTRNAEELEVLLPPQELNVIGWQHLVSTGVRTLVLESTTLAERELADVGSAVELFNPYHDDKGRFTSKAGAVSVIDPDPDKDIEIFGQWGGKYKVYVPNTKQDLKPGDPGFRRKRLESQILEGLRKTWGHDDLSGAEEEALTFYVGSGHYGINHHLRGAGDKLRKYIRDKAFSFERTKLARKLYRKELLAKIVSDALVLKEAVLRHTIKDDVALFRNIYGAAGEEIRALVDKGGRYVLGDKGLISTSLFSRGAHLSTHDALPLVILVPKGAPGLVTENSWESEIILPSQEFEIIGWRDSTENVWGIPIRVLILEAFPQITELSEPLELYNPYHDAKGRFTSRAGSASPVDRVGVNVERGVARFEGEEYTVVRPHEDERVDRRADFQSRFIEARYLQSPLLTEGETEAIRDYISTGFTAINAYLRKHVPEDPYFSATIASWLERVGGIPKDYLDYLVEGFGSDDRRSIIENLDAHDIEDIILNYTPSVLKKFAEAVTKAATRHKLPGNITLFRWASDESLVEDLQRGLADNLIGDEFVDGGMISTTWAAADEGYVAKGPLLAILKRAGQCGLFTQNYQELEVLLPPQTFDIVDIGPVPFPSRFIEGITGMAPNERQVIYLAGGI